MSAPWVTTTVRAHPADEFGPGWTSYETACSECGAVLLATREDDAREWVERHESSCSRLRLARLQARWDARNEAERALVEQWRAEADEKEARHMWATAAKIRAFADELERAIEIRKWI